jgi:hypothetical protein
LPQILPIKKACYYEWAVVDSKSFIAPLVYLFINYF